MVPLCSLTIFAKSCSNDSIIFTVLPIRRLSCLFATLLKTFFYKKNRLFRYMSKEPLLSYNIFSDNIALTQYLENLRLMSYRTYVRYLIYRLEITRRFALSG